MVVVVLIVAVVGILYYESTIPGIQVSGINVYAPDNVCGLNTYPIGYYGFNDSTGATDSFVLTVPNYNSTTCSIQQVSTNTSGFVATAQDLPWTILGSPPGNLGSSEGNFTLTLALPGSPFSGVLNLVFG